MTPVALRPRGDRVTAPLPPTSDPDALRAYVRRLDQTLSTDQLIGYLEQLVEPLEPAARLLVMDLSAVVGGRIAAERLRRG